jgi:anti-sigma-K factor RskA
MNKTGATATGAAALLPWYVNGTLGAEERRMVETALAENDGLRQELDRLQRLSLLVADEAVPAPEPAADGFARLRRKMLASAPARPAGRTGWAESAHGFFAFAFRPAVLAGLAVIVVIEGAAIVSLVPSAQPHRFVTASGPADGARAVVKFKPETTLSEIQSILQAEQATIVRGPTPDGALVVQWNGLGIDEVDRAIARLRTNQAFVLRAERGT